MRIVKNDDEIFLTDEELKAEIHKAGYTFPLLLDFLEKDIKKEINSLKEEQITKPGGRNITYAGKKEGDGALYKLFDQRDKGDNGNWLYRPHGLNVRGRQMIKDPAEAWFIIFCATGVEGNLVDANGYSNSHQVRIYDQERIARQKMEIIAVDKRLKDKIIVDRYSTPTEKKALRGVAKALGFPNADKEDITVLSYSVLNYIEPMTNQRKKDVLSILMDKNEVKLRTLVQTAKDRGIARIMKKGASKVWMLLNENGEEVEAFLKGMIPSSDHDEELIRALKNNKSLVDMLTAEVDKRPS